MRTVGSMVRQTSSSWVFWSLLSALFAGITAILAKTGVGQVNPNLATAIRTSVVVIFTWLIVAAVDPSHEVASLSRRSLLFLAASGIATGLSWLCYFRALSLGPASKVAPVDKLSVVFVLLLAWPVLGERLTWEKCAGAGLITAGAVVLAWAK